MPSFIKKCPECGGINLILNKDKGEVICKDCGLVIEEADKMRRTGAPMTYSVEFSEPIIVKQNGKIKIVKIGKFIDTILAERASFIKKDGIIEYVPVTDLECVSFDKNYDIAFRKISEVSRHPSDNFYEISLESNRKVKVTGSHSVFTVENNEVIPIQVEKLKEGQFLVAPKEIPLVENIVTDKESP
ncbi:hypothetical protein HYX19_00235 [Candidatus Woesearchaeota archaeon]|nr:hypothetical protein [Candidatus Woesearchaeota archaeon]